MAPRRDTAAGEESLWRHAHFSAACRGGQNELVHWPAEPEMLRICQAVQAQLWADLTERRVVVEINPSSNRMVNAVDSLTQHPFFRLRELSGGGLRLTMNTEDGGARSRCEAQTRLGC